MGFPFSSGDVLTAADMNAIGNWVSFTPSWNNLTIGDGTDQWQYAVINDVLMIEGRTILGSTTVVSSQPGFDLPNSFTLQNVGQPYGIALYNDSGTGSYFGHIIPSGPTAMRFAELNVSGSLLKQENVTGGSPFNWTTGDQIRATMTMRLK